MPTNHLLTNRGRELPTKTKGAEITHPIGWKYKNFLDQMYKHAYGQHVFCIRRPFDKLLAQAPHIRQLHLQLGHRIMTVANLTIDNKQTLLSRLGYHKNRCTALPRQGSMEECPHPLGLHFPLLATQWGTRCTMRTRCAGGITVTSGVLEPRVMSKFAKWNRSFNSTMKPSSFGQSCWLQQSSWGQSCRVRTVIHSFIHSSVVL